MGASPDDNGELRQALRAAVGLIERSQGPEGGWHYSPEISALHEGSVTITYVQALRAARNAGIRVDFDVIRKAEDYVLRLQDDQGRFAYQLDDDRTTVALTAAGIATTNCNEGGCPRCNDLAAGGTRLDECLCSHGEENAIVQAAYHGVQLTDSTIFESWFARERERILRSQHADGSWRCQEYGDCYATAVNCLVLALPEGLLPIFQR